MISFWITANEIKDGIYIPKYYNKQFITEIKDLEGEYTFYTIKELIENDVIRCDTGHEIGKAAYGTGDIPFVRTSDISNWELKSFPKQGVSREIFEAYAAVQDVQVGDILFVRDGTYLIGSNCYITEIDKDILYQSHILKIRILDKEILKPHILFLALNNSYVQEQIRSFQFTADIIDTIGQRFNEIVIPIPNDNKKVVELIDRCDKALHDRMFGKAFIKHCPRLMEEIFQTGSVESLTSFESLSYNQLIDSIENETVTSEFGSFTAFWHKSSEIKKAIYLPTYYDINISSKLETISQNCDLFTIAQLRSENVLEYHTGDEIGKMAYGTGNISFLRTSDFANWEIKHNPKQGISENIYKRYAVSQDIKENDILLVRDGTYLVGSTAIITSYDIKSLYCGGIFKFRINCDPLDPFLFLAIMNSYIVKRQMRTKQFTRDVIDTLGNRIDEVVLPIPKDKQVRFAISNSVRNIIHSRIHGREEISSLSNLLLTNEAKSRN